MSEDPAVEQPVSSRRRILAVISLVATALLIVAGVAFLVNNVVLLIVGLIGLSCAGWGAWWMVTEQLPRRAIGIGGIVVGLVVLGFAAVRAAASFDQGLLDILVLVVLFAIAVGCARAALVRDLHSWSQATHVGPSHPVLICNPWSGGGKVDQFGLRQIAEELDLEVVMLDHGLDLEELARDAIARGADCLGMAGGDGSQALVAAIAIEHELPFVCISAGTRNHFALDLGLDRDDPRKGMVAFRDGVERTVDYATVGDRLFVNNVSLGIYATIVQQDSYRDAKVDTTKQLIPELLGRQAEPFDLQFTTPDGIDVDGAFLILVSNNPYVMGPALDVSQRRSVETGQLGVFAVNARTGAEAARLITRTTIGLGRSNPNVFDFTTQAFQVRSRSGQAFVGIDGEALDLATPLDFRIHPRGLRLLVPPESIVESERRRVRGVHLRDLLAVAAGRHARA